MRKIDGGVAAFDLELSKELWSWEGQGTGWPLPGVLSEDTYFYVHGLDGGALEWALHVPNGQVHDFVSSTEGRPSKLRHRRSDPRSRSKFRLKIPSIGRSIFRKRFTKSRLSVNRPGQHSYGA